MNRTPKVSLGLPVYNGENYLEKAIDSVLNQTFEDFELVISDNASTDGTQAICEMYAARDARIRYHRNTENLGAVPNYNRVFELSSGKYFKWIAHDDVIAPEFLERCVSALEQDSYAVLCSTEVGIINAIGQLVESYDVNLNMDASSPSARFRSLLLDWHLCFDVFGLIRSEVLRQTPAMGNYGHGDGVLLAHLSLLGTFHKIRGYHSYFRRHPGQSMRLYGYYSDSGRNDYQAYAVWCDSSHDGKIIFPHWRILQEYWYAIRHSDVNRWQRFRATLYLLRWLARKRRGLLNDLVAASRFVFRRMASEKSLEGT